MMPTLKRRKKSKLSKEDFRFLAATDLFGAIPKEGESRLLACLTPLTVRAGERLIHQGDVSDCLYLIQEGSCSIIVERDGKRNRVAHRRSGEIIGEMSIMTSEHRTAHVEAETDMTLWRMSRVDFEELCLAYPEIHEFVVGLVSKRISVISNPIDEMELRIRLESLLKTKVVQDELKRYQAELEKTIEKRTQALRASEARFRTVFEAAQDFIFIKDTELRYSQINPAMLTFIGDDCSNIIGKTDEDVFGSDYETRIAELEARVLQGQTLETEHMINFKEQSIALNIIRFPMRDPQNEIIGICGIARDVTERKLRFTDQTVCEATKYQSEAMQKTIFEAELAARSDSIILLLGESGCGKDFWARYLHEHSNRANGPFFAINCAALAPELIESELFGHEPGAFTGSHGRKRGLLELAEGGTLLLNEIGELHPRLQSKLLTFLDTESFVRVGGEKLTEVNARIIAATNRDLEKGVKRGEFREDLFHRLNVFSICIPPLRDRMDDIHLLVTELLTSLCRKMGLTRIPLVDSAARQLLVAYDWPGNIRELRNVLERALILSDKKHITISDLSIIEKTGRRTFSKDELCFTVRVSQNGSMRKAIIEAKRFLVSEGLRKSGGSIKKAAELLGISRDSFVHFMKTFNIRR